MRSTYARKKWLQSVQGQPSIPRGKPASPAIGQGVRGMLEPGDRTARQIWGTHRVGVTNVGAQPAQICDSHPPQQRLSLCPIQTGRCGSMLVLATRSPWPRHRQSPPSMLAIPGHNKSTWRSLRLELHMHKQENVSTSILRRQV